MAFITKVKAKVNDFGFTAKAKGKDLWFPRPRIIRLEGLFKDF